jgi:hypothetical protein
MSTHVYIEVDYTVMGGTHVELPFPWEEVADWCIKWNILFVTLKDASKHEFRLSDSFDQEFKHPSGSRIWPADEDGSQIDGDTLAEDC